MHYKKPKDRNELLLNPNIGLWVDQDNPVRLIELVVEQFVRENAEICSWGGYSDQGCKSYPPTTLLKLLIYCYFNWISGSRRMEKETHRNIEVMWLLGGLKPDHWTICKFRRENRELIRSAAIGFRKFLKSNGYIDGKTVVFDGSKMKAYARREMYSDKQLQSRIENIEKNLEKYLANIEEIDELEDRLEQESKDKEDLQKKISKLQNDKDKLEGLKKKLKGSKKKYISPTDPDASLMRSRDGKMACYNVQTSVDEKHHMITTAEVTEEECDIALLKTDLEQLKEQLDIIPDEIEADKGYGNRAQIREIQETSGTICYVPVQEPPLKSRDKKNGIEFIYHAEDDSYKCPNNKSLHLCKENFKQDNQTYNIYKCNDCTGCLLRDKCTKAKTGRKIKVNISHEWIDKYREWLQREETKKKILQRKSIVEHPFGTIKMIMGKFCFLLRKRYKVQIEVDLYATAYNLKRLITIENVGILLQKVQNYRWKIE